MPIKYFWWVLIFLDLFGLKSDVCKQGDCLSERSQKIIKDEMDYTLCKLLLDYLYFRKLIDEEKWIKATTEIKAKYDPPTLMLEDLYGKGSN